VSRYNKDKKKQNDNQKMIKKGNIQNEYKMLTQLYQIKRMPDVPKSSFVLFVCCIHMSDQEGGFKESKGRVRG
jgi:hypothetical protein